jgi:hypothetical protein
MDIPNEITCIDCGGVASRISYLPPDEEPEPGVIVAYRCADCMERFDVVIEADDVPTEGDQPR